MPSTLILFIARKLLQENLSLVESQYQTMLARSGKQGLEVAQKHNPQLIILDAASMNTNGERICRNLKHQLKHIPLIHIHPGPRDDAKSQGDVLMFSPVYGRQLLNSIGNLLNSEREEVIGAGPFSMNVPRRLLIAYGEETQLTPKQASLIELFLRRPGQTVDRKAIMEKVWKTDYLGDTRTLDVHIRAIRKKLENGGSRPRCIETVRGVGYRLVIPGRAPERALENQKPTM